MKKLAEKSIFLEVVGDTPKTRLFNFLITFKSFDYSMTDVARNACISYRNLQNILPALVKAGIVIETRKVGKARMFKLNEENITANALIKAHWLIIESVVSKKYGIAEQKEQRIPVLMKR